jgi:hypothetical protein
LGMVECLRRMQQCIEVEIEGFAVRRGSFHSHILS